MYSNGEAVIDIATALGANYNTVRTVINLSIKSGEIQKRIWKKQRKKDLPKSKIDTQKIIELYNEGMPYAKIAKMFQVQTMAIQHKVFSLISKNEITRRLPRNQKLSAQNISEIIRSRSEGIKVAVLAEKFGVSGQCIRENCKSNTNKISIENATPIERFLEFISFFCSKELVSIEDLKNHMHMKKSSVYKYIAITNEHFNICKTIDKNGDIYYHIDKKTVQKYFNL